MLARTFCYVVTETANKSAAGSVTVTSGADAEAALDIRSIGLRNQFPRRNLFVRFD